MYLCKQSCFFKHTNYWCSIFLSTELPCRMAAFHDMIFSMWQAIAHWFVFSPTRGELRQQLWTALAPQVWKTGKMSPYGSSGDLCSPRSLAKQKSFPGTPKWNPDHSGQRNTLSSGCTGWICCGTLLSLQGGGRVTVQSTEKVGQAWL